MDENVIYEAIKIVGSCLGYTLSAITLITMIVKPIRNKFIRWVKQTGDVDTTKLELTEIKNMLQTHINADVEKQETLKRLAEAEKASLRNSILHLCDLCLKRNSITSIEKLNLIDMYTEYHNLGGDTYCTDRYELTLDLPEKN